MMLVVMMLVMVFRGGSGSGSVGRGSRRRQCADADNSEQKDAEEATHGFLRLVDGHLLQVAARTPELARCVRVLIRQGTRFIACECADRDLSLAGLTLSVACCEFYRSSIAQLEPGARGPWVAADSARWAFPAVDQIFSMVGKSLAITSVCVCLFSLPRYLRRPSGPGSADR